MKKEHIRTISGIIHCVSGLRVGGSDELLAAGADDLTVIKHPVTLQPYLPGSTLKGRLRAEMEFKEGRFGRNKENQPTEPCTCGTCMICRVFGPHKNLTHSLGPTRLLVRDAQPVAGRNIAIEVKTESANNRQTGTAHSPRKIERVPAGSEFVLRLVLQIWDQDATAAKYAGQTGEPAMLEFLKEALRRVQAIGIGGGLSRGSGEIEFRDLKLDNAQFTL